MGPIEKHISKFFTKKSTADNQSVKPEKMSPELAEPHVSRAAKVEYDESVENQPDGVKQQPSEDVKNEVVTYATIGNQDDLGIKRKIKDTEVIAAMKMENSGWSPSHPTKREKIAKAASSGQTSLLSFFSRK